MICRYENENHAPNQDLDCNLHSQLRTDEPPMPSGECYRGVAPTRRLEESRPSKITNRSAVIEACNSTEQQHAARQRSTEMAGTSIW